MFWASCECLYTYCCITGEEEPKTSTENSENVESDIDSSQQSNTTDSQLADNENSSQVQNSEKHKIKCAKT